MDIIQYFSKHPRKIAGRFAQSVIFNQSRIVKVVFLAAMLQFDAFKLEKIISYLSDEDQLPIVLAEASDAIYFSSVFWIMRIACSYNLCDIEHLLSSITKDLSPEV